MMKRLPVKIDFMGLLGPFFLLATLSIALLRVSHAAACLFPIAIGAGLFLCTLYHFRGFLISFGLIFISLLISTASLPLEARFWEIGIALAGSIALLIVCLVQEAVELQTKSSNEENSLLQKELKELQLQKSHLQGEWKSAKKSLDEEMWRLEEHICDLRKRAEGDKEEAKSQIDLLEERVNEGQRWQHKAQSLHSQLQAREEERQKQSHELASLRTLLSKIEQERLTWQEEGSELKAQIQSWKEKVDQEKVLANSLREELNSSRSQLHQVQLDAAAEKERLKEQIAATCLTSDTHFARWQEALQEVEKVQLELATSQQKIADMSSCANPSLEGKLAASSQQIEELTKQVQQHRHLEGQLKQLKSQFEEKSQMLAATRVKLWQTESQLLGFKRDQEETQRSPAPTESKLIAELVKVQEEYEGATKDIASLEGLVEELLGELKKRCIPTMAFSKK